MNRREAVIGLGALAVLACSEPTKPNYEQSVVRDNAAADGDLRFHSLYADTIYSPIVKTRSIALTDASGNDVLKMELGPDNQRGVKRLRFAFQGNASAEVEIEPGSQANPIGNIVSQVMLWGRRTPDGTGRNRVSLSLNSESDGNEAAYLDATTNGGGRGMSLCLNVVEGVSYLCIHPDRTIEVQDRVAGTSRRFLLSEFGR